MTSTLSAPENTTHPTPQASKVAILDCGAQYTKLIDRLVRQMAIETTIFPLNTPAEKLQGYQAIILSGGPRSVHANDALAYDPEIFKIDTAFLGICYGMQLIAQHFGGTVEKGAYQEYGQTDISISATDNPLFAGLSNSETVLMSHGDHVSVLPPNFETLAQTDEGILAAYHSTLRPVYGVQFHPEVELSLNGQAMLKNFLLNIAQCQQNFTLQSRLDAMITEIQTFIKDRPVLTLVSGGVDSAVSTALLLKALPKEQVYALHIDHGMMRLNESEDVCRELENLGLQHLTHLKSADDFLNATSDMDGTITPQLKQATDPEVKRRIIGDTFLKLTQQAIENLNLDLSKTVIAQGTLRPDLIESGNVDVSQSASTIKTHHNDVPLIQEQRKKGLIIETNRDLHKDEVREIGRKLGLAESIVSRQPFPGPGLGIRVLCATQPSPVANTPQVQAQATEIIKAENITPVLLPIKSVGVQGDARSYRHPLALFGCNARNVEEATKINSWAQAIPNRLQDINRVIIALNTPSDITPQFIPTTLSIDVLDLLRQVDALVLGELQKAGVLNKFAQTFSVLLPVGFGSSSQRSIVIRAVITSDFMTARTATLQNELPFELLQSIAQQVITQFDISAVFYDLTPKPPATVEWE